MEGVSRRTAGNLSVQVVAKIGGKIALSLVGAKMLAPLISTITYPTMAGFIRGVSNWHDTREIAKAAIYRYKSAGLNVDCPPADAEQCAKFQEDRTKALEGISHGMQDHFLHSKQANYHRRLHNVFYPRIREQSEEIRDLDQKMIDNLFLRKARNDEEEKLTEKVIEIRQEINFIDESFKCSAGLVRDSLTVETLIKQSQQTHYSKSQFIDLVREHAPALLTLQASTEHVSAKLLDRFRSAYKARTGTAITDQMLLAHYDYARSQMKNWVRKNQLSDMPTIFPYGLLTGFRPATPRAAVRDLKDLL